MNYITLQRTEAGATRTFAGPLRAFSNPARLRETTGQRIEDRQFLEMDSAFRRTGGLASGDEVARLLRRQSEQPISTLARWIVAREVVSFEWRSQTLLPLFQFDRHDLLLRPRAAHIVQELAGTFDDWETALWFAQPNAWLHDMAPADAIVHNAAEVFHAARADRFVAHG